MNRVIGTFLSVLVTLIAIQEWGHPSPILDVLRIGTVVGLLIVMTPVVSKGRQSFVVIAILLSVGLVHVRPNGWQQILVHAFDNAAFIGAYFCTLSTLQLVACQSLSVHNAGLFLSTQTPRRRYIALTLGTQLFATILNYGAISLLGNLALISTKNELNKQVQLHRTRRMLIAIQRGFISVLTWSPLSFAIPVTISLIPDTSWSDIAIPGIISSLILAGVGLILDTLFKPRLSLPIKKIEPIGDWNSLLPLSFLFVILAVLIGILYLLTEVRIVGIVLVIVPFIALVWIILQNNSGNKTVPLRKILSQLVFDDLSNYKGELVLLMMAGYIGTVGAPLLMQILGSFPTSLSGWPTWAILVGLIWVIPLAGQFGMNPILIATLIIPILPSASEMGVNPSTIAVALTAGWALSGATSPFTATTILTGSMGGVSARYVGLNWNGPFALISGVALSFWIVILSNMAA